MVLYQRREEGSRDGDNYLADEDTSYMCTSYKSRMTLWLYKVFGEAEEVWQSKWLCGLVLNRQLSRLACKVSHMKQILTS